MPCIDGRDSPAYINEEMQKRVDQNARIACKCLTVLESIGLMLTDPEVISWWNQHKEMDEERNKNGHR